MQVTGHSTREMFDRYNTIDVEDTKQEIGQFQGYIRKYLPKRLLNASK